MPTGTFFLSLASVPSSSSDSDLNWTCSYYSAYSLRVLPSCCPLSSALPR